MAKLNKDSILALKNSQELNGLNLSPEAAFILSRIDGKTSLEIIGFMSDMQVDKAIEILGPLVDAGVVTVEQGEAGAKKEVGSILDLLDHEDRDRRYSQIPREFRREVLLLFSRLGELDHFALYNLKRNASDDKVKTSYFELAKKFHPDRFFAKDIGHYKGKITRIYEKINTAYQILSNPRRRQSYLDSLEEMEGKGKADSTIQSTIKKAVVENMNRARRYFQWGEEDYIKGNYASAASNYLLAINFDKSNEEYKRAYDRVAPFVQRKKARELAEMAEEKFVIGEFGQAYENMKTAVEKYPREGNFLLKLARFALAANVDVAKAAEYNKRALGILGETAYGLVTEALLQENRRKLEDALALYQRAAEIDPADKDIKAAVKRLKKSTKGRKSHG